MKAENRDPSEICSLANQTPSPSLPNLSTWWHLLGRPRIVSALMRLQLCRTFMPSRPPSKQFQFAVVASSLLCSKFKDKLATPKIQLISYRALKTWMKKTFALWSLSELTCVSLEKTVHTVVALVCGSRLLNLRNIFGIETHNMTYQLLMCHIVSLKFRVGSPLASLVFLLMSLCSSPFLALRFNKNNE